MGLFDVTRYGATGDGVTDDTKSVAAAIEACASSGGGTVYFPAGTYATGPIRLQSRMTLHVDNGARIVFSNRFEDYPPTKTRWSGYECYAYSPLIFGSGLEHVSIKGDGVICGNGKDWWDANRKTRQGLRSPSPVDMELSAKNRDLLEMVKSNIVEWKTQFLRPPLLQFIDCKHVALEGVTLQDSPFWNTHLVYCRDVNVRGVTIRNPADAPNGDGLDIDSCAEVRISDCLFDVGDDCLCLKSGIDEDGRRVGRPTENIVITNCIMLRGHGGVVMGSEMSGGIRNVVISNCIFKGTDRGIRIKTNRQRGGYVREIHVSQVYMEDLLCPFAINAFYRHGVDEGDPSIQSPDAIPVTESTPVIRDIRLSHIAAKNCRASAGFIFGLPEMPVEDISLSHVTLEMTDDPSEPGGEPDMVREKIVMAGDGIYCKHVRGLELHRVKVETRQGPALTMDHVQDDDIDGLIMKKRHPDTPLIRRGFFPSGVC